MNREFSYGRIDRNRVSISKFGEKAKTSFEKRLKGQIGQIGQIVEAKLHHVLRMVKIIFKKNCHLSFTYLN